MALDYTTHSIWISTAPAQPPLDSHNKPIWGASTYTLPEDSTFIFLGGRTSFTYSNTYNANVMGIPGQTSASAYFTDSASGSVSDISISCIRVQPTDPDDTSQNLNNISNAKFKQMLYNMKNVMQLKQGAYILRLFNNTQNINASGKAFDFPVYLESYSAEVNQERPFEMNVSLKLKRRAPILGFNLGTTGN